ncbi:TPA: hypothetical protein ACF5BV_003913 [Vibrio parahaemolyticus]|uniref:hypothetical protein n=2 Tax=Vibrio TaxID=662 RepID=UPI000AD3A25B|nr:hypothetical protein [Vibrio parahaemolyticus]EIE1260403.1 hypothetical protein [Vibrio parahaemolyticus]EJC6807745.1 hypothetical protein [Vibrio parahaemolyticus]EJG1693094.1 hypothetical protein [Vibrio parahaemolyticus]HAS3040338.1 hypothetical protein [Vibrio parahaemolyticus]HAS3077676.1 hypothetical protein [Vibrio parahaemolyticus]
MEANIMTPEQKEIYEEGYSAFLNSEQDTSNPYSGLDAEYWSDGYEDAQEDLKNKEGKSMLSQSEKERYSNALKGLKAQATAVTSRLPNTPVKAELSAAQSLMAENELECRVIYRLVMKYGVPVPELEESLLFEWLELPAQ